MKPLPFIHQPDRVAREASNLSADDWWYQTREKIIRFFHLCSFHLCFFSGLEILILQRSLYDKLYCFISAGSRVSWSLCSVPHIIRLHCTLSMQTNWAALSVWKVSIYEHNLFRPRWKATLASLWLSIMDSVFFFLKKSYAVFGGQHKGMISWWLIIRRPGREIKVAFSNKLWRSVDKT